MSNEVPLLELRLGHLTLSECTSVGVGHLLVAPACGADERPQGSDCDGVRHVVHTKDIPTAEDLRLDCPMDSRTPKFQVRCFGGVAVDVNVLWGSYPGWDR